MPRIFLTGSVAKVLSETDMLFVAVVDDANKHIGGSKGRPHRTKIFSISWCFRKFLPKWWVGTIYAIPGSAPEFSNSETSKF